MVKEFKEWSKLIAMCVVGLTYSYWSCYCMGVR
jgi:hypothetical protein